MKLNVVINPVLTLLLLLLGLSNASGQQMIPAGSGIDGAAIDTASSSPNMDVRDIDTHREDPLIRANPQGPNTQGADVSPKQDLMRRIRLLEAAGRKAEVDHATDLQVGRIHAQIGFLYIDAAMWDQAEAELERAVSLLRSAESTGDLATTLSTLGSLHTTMGELREGEVEVLEAARLREQLGDRLDLARSWSDLATLYIAEHKSGKAQEYAQKATDEFVANGRATPAERIEARYSLSLALCSAKKYAPAVQVLRVAVDEAVVALKPRDFRIGVGEFLLGYADWKSGDVPEAADYMERGTAQMSAELGWGHPVYVYALKRYAMFLRESRRMEEASALEQRIRRAEAVVDVQSLQARSGMGAFAGLP
jgi:hypothetical protein